MTLGRLADVLGSDQATASILVDRLCSAELVTRVTDPSDRRRVQLFPKEQALLLADQLGPARVAAEKLIEEALGLRDMETLRQLLGRLRAFLEEHKAATVAGSRSS